MSQLNHSVGARLELKATDLECLDIITRYGPLSPSDLARRTGQICAEYDDDELELLGGFLRRTADAGRTAAERLAGS